VYQSQSQYGYGAPGYQQQYGGQRAGFWSRFLGWFLDSLLAFVAVIPGAILIGLSFAFGHDDICERNSFSREPELYKCRQPQPAWLTVGILVAAAGVIAFFIFLVLRLGRTGQTPGRKAAGVKVVDKHGGQPIGSGKALGRYLFASFISGQVCYLCYLWMLWDGDKQTWHDKVVNSVVIKV